MDAFFDIMDVNDIMLLQLRSRRQKVYKKRINPFDLSEENFKTQYRFSKNYAKEIVRIVRADLELDGRGCAVTPELQVLIALRAWTRPEVIMCMLYFYKYNKMLTS